MPDANYEALIGVGALPLVILFLTSHIKQFIKAVRDEYRPPNEPEFSEWPLVADLVGMAFATAAWYAAWIPQDKVDSPLGAALFGLVVAVAVQRGYDATK